MLTRNFRYYEDNLESVVKAFLLEDAVKCNIVANMTKQKVQKFYLRHVQVLISKDN